MGKELGEDGMKFGLEVWKLWEMVLKAVGRVSKI